MISLKNLFPCGLLVMMLIASNPLPGRCFRTENLTRNSLLTAKAIDFYKLLSQAMITSKNLPDFPSLFPKLIHNNNISNFSCILWTLQHYLALSLIITLQMNSQHIISIISYSIFINLTSFDEFIISFLMYGPSCQQYFIFFSSLAFSVQ